jgi:hypothetical protein
MGNYASHYVEIEIKKNSEALIKTQDGMQIDSLNAGGK